MASWGWASLSGVGGEYDLQFHVLVYEAPRSPPPSLGQQPGSEMLKKRPQRIPEVHGRTYRYPPSGTNSWRGDSSHFARKEVDCYPSGFGHELLSNQSYQYGRLSLGVDLPVVEFPHRGSPHTPFGRWEHCEDVEGKEEHQRPDSI